MNNPMRVHEQNSILSPQSRHAYTSTHDCINDKDIHELLYRKQASYIEDKIQVADMHIDHLRGNTLCFCSIDSNGNLLANELAECSWTIIQILTPLLQSDILASTSDSSPPSSRATKLVQEGPRCQAHLSSLFTLVFGSARV